MNRLLTLTLGVALGAGGIALTAACLPEAPPPAPAPVHPTITLVPCATEDAANCYWDAATMGNGAGRSFVNIDGTYYYP